MKRFLRSRFVSEYGSLFVLLLLCGYYSVVTFTRQYPLTPGAGRRLAREIVRVRGPQASVLIAIRDTDRDRAFAAAVQAELQAAGARVLETVAGEPTDLRRALDRWGAAGMPVHAIATHHAVAEWGPLQPDRLARAGEQYPALAELRVHEPAGYWWPSFLTRENLLNVVNQNAEIAIIAIGMTLVIITAGIDLSVGSLLALSGVVTAVAIQHWAGGSAAGPLGLFTCALLGVGLCAVFGAFSGVMITVFRVPAFIVTLALMMIARGLALKIAVRSQSLLAGGQTEGTPEAVKIGAAAFDWLGNGTLMGIPNPILLMIALYVMAHIVMTRTALGRHIYAVGGNPEAARLSGVNVYGVLILVYTICGAMAGLGGIVDASRFEGGRPNAGSLYELQVIAAVVVGGTSLAGGEGRVFGTLIGALIIAVIQNGLNMAGVEPYDQMVVFGCLILAAVLLDLLKKRSWKPAG
jgi:ribose transport system permease protein